MKMVCAYCGCKRFVGHQLVRMDVVVDEDNGFIEQHGESPVYDSETPYGPYTCEDCGAEFDVVNDRFEMTQARKSWSPQKTAKWFPLSSPRMARRSIPLTGTSASRAAAFPARSSVPCSTGPRSPHGSR